MLQQTQAARVVEPYVRFLAAFPTPAACAAAGAPAVVRAWDGPRLQPPGPQPPPVGRPCWSSATAGRCPADLDALRALPGVGPYTARAVLCFAFEADAGVVDTNVARVLARAVAGRPLRGGRGPGRGRRPGPVGPLVGLQPGALRPRGPALHGPAPGLRRLPAGPQLRLGQVRLGRPDPSVGSAGVGRSQSPFDGSDRQGRGRLVDALRRGPLAEGDLARRRAGPTTRRGPGGWPTAWWPRGSPAGSAAGCGSAD